MMMALMLVSIGGGTLNQTLSRPQLAGIRTVDVVSLTGSGACFGVAMAILIAALIAVLIAALWRR